MGERESGIAGLAGEARAAAHHVRARMIGPSDVDITILDAAERVLGRTRGSSELGSEFALAAALDKAGVRVESWECEERPDGNILTATNASMRR